MLCGLLCFSTGIFRHMLRTILVRIASVFNLHCLALWLELSYCELPCPSTGLVWHFDENHPGVHCFCFQLALFGGWPPFNDRPVIFRRMWACKVVWVYFHELKWACKVGWVYIHGLEWACKVVWAYVHELEWVCKVVWVHVHELQWVCRVGCMYAHAYQWACKIVRPWDEVSMHAGLYACMLMPISGSARFYVQELEWACRVIGMYA